MVANHTLAGVYASEAIRDCQAGLISFIAIVGHSLGGHRRRRYGGEQLGQAGIKVGLFVTVDPISPSDAPGSVKTLENFYPLTGSARPW